MIDKRLSTNKTVLIHLVLITILVLSFWIFSRYPSLQGKITQENISFFGEVQGGTLWKIFNTDNYDTIEKIAFETLNWININFQGMIFGILLSALFLSLAKFLPLNRFNIPFSELTKGFVFGTPLGVCINCASPLLHSKNYNSIKFRLAAVFSSASFNPIVLFILFSQFEIHQALLKVLSVLLVIFYVIPWLLKKCNVESIENSSKTSFDSVDEKIAKSISRSLKEVLIVAIPIMILSGFLGALVSIYFPFYNWKINGGISFFTVLILSLLVPIPIALDLILAKVVLSMTGDIKLSMILLFSLGSFSLIPLSYCYRFVSKKFAGYLFFSLIILFSLFSLFSFYLETSLQKFDRSFLNIFTEEVKNQRDMSFNNKEYFLKVEDKVRALESSDLTYLEARDIGIHHLYEISNLGLPQVGMLKGISVADFNNDGFDDVLISTSYGIKVFKNMGGEFLNLGILPNTQEINTTGVAFLDLDNDGQEEFVVSTILNGVIIIRKDLESSFVLEGTENLVVASMSFADIDSNGEVDIILGNTFVGQYFFRVNDRKLSNRIFFQNKGSFKEYLISSEVGETTSILASRLNSKKLKIIVGNDFGTPSVAFMWDNQKSRDLVFDKFKDVTNTGMSIDVADVNNDLDNEVFISASHHDPEGLRNLKKEIDLLCDKLEEDEKSKCLIKARYASQLKLVDAIKVFARDCSNKKGEVKKHCYSIAALGLAFSSENESDCEKISNDYSYLKSICINSFNEVHESLRYSLDYNDLNITSAKNMFYFLRGNKYEDRATDFKLDRTCWSWEAKFSDLNHDTYTDLYIVNGFWSIASHCPNFLLLNEKGNSFREYDNFENNNDLAMSSSFVFIDYDRDGDLDILRNSHLSTFTMINNGIAKGNYIKIKLEAPMSLALTSIVIIELEDGRKLRRDFLLGRGLSSYESRDLHFGIGNNEYVKSVKVIWRDDIRETFLGNFEANQTHSIKRRAP